jgi:hypothetical protein
LHDAESVPSHPEQKALLALGPGVDARVKERTQQPSVAEKDPQQLVVIDVDGVEAGCVEEIIAVNKNCDATPMPKLPG